METDLSKRQCQLIDILRKETSFCTSRKLAELIDVSEKTVRNEVASINEVMKETVIISRKSKGYQLVDKQRWISVLNINEENKRLEIQILKEILMKPSVDYYELADLFFVSTSALNKIIAKLNDEISGAFENVRIIRENNQLHFNCDDQEKRKVLTYFLLEESKKQSFDISVLDSYFSQINVRQLADVLLQYVKKTEEEIMDINFLSMLLHLLVIVSNQDNLSEPILYETNVPQYELVRRMADEMKIYFNEEGLRLLDTAFEKQQTSCKGETENIFYERFLSTVLKEVYEIYTINFDDDCELKSNLLSHLKHLKIRCQQNKQVKNPLLEQLKKNYVLVYDIAVYISMRFRDFTDFLPDENEISFIALHVLNGLQNIKTSSVRVALINPYEKAVTAIMERYLLEIPFVEIVGQFSVFDSKSLYKEKPDLIITLANIKPDSRYMVYRIRDYLDKDEYREIQQIIREIRVKKAYENTIIRNCFFDELFVVEEECGHKNEIIDLLCDKLEKQGFVDEEYRKQVYMREGIASTCFGCPYAIPHSLKKIAKKNAIAVAILKQPVLWDGFDVRMVFMFAFHKSFDQVPKLYEMILNALDNKERFNQLLTAKDCNEFKQYLLG